MKINRIGSINPVNPYSRNMDAKGYSVHAKGKSKDTVDISDAAKELLDNRSADREARIQELKNSVTAGAYQVDARKLAEKLLPYLR